MTLLDRIRALAGKILLSRKLTSSNPYGHLLLTVREEEEARAILAELESPRRADEDRGLTAAYLVARDAAAEGNPRLLDDWVRANTTAAPWMLIELMAGLLDQVGEDDYCTHCDRGHSNHGPDCPVVAARTEARAALDARLDGCPLDLDEAIREGWAVLRPHGGLLIWADSGGPVGHGWREHVIHLDSADPATRSSRWTTDTAHSPPIAWASYYPVERTAVLTAWSEVRAWVAAGRTEETAPWRDSAPAATGDPTPEQIRAVLEGGAPRDTWQGFVHEDGSVQCARCGGAGIGRQLAGTRLLACRNCGGSGRVPNIIELASPPVTDPGDSHEPGTPATACPLCGSELIWSLGGTYHGSANCANGMMAERDGRPASPPCQWAGSRIERATPNSVRWRGSVDRRTWAEKADAVNNPV